MQNEKNTEAVKYSSHTNIGSKRQASGFTLIHAKDTKMCVSHPKLNDNENKINQEKNQSPQKLSNG